MNYLKSDDGVKIEHVLVYGTLRPGCGANRKMKGKTIHVGTYRVPGRIYSLGGFPGVRFGGSPVHTFVGDLYKIEDTEVLDVLDTYEGYRGPDKTDNLYNRVIIEVPLEDGQTIPAWVYEFNREIAGEPIRSGDWLNRDIRSLGQD